MIFGTGLLLHVAPFTVSVCYANRSRLLACLCPHYNDIVIYKIIQGSGELGSSSVRDGRFRTLEQAKILACDTDDACVAVTGVKGVSCKSSEAKFRYETLSVPRFDSIGGFARRRAAGQGVTLHPSPTLRTKLTRLLAEAQIPVVCETPCNRGLAQQYCTNTGNGKILGS